ncbi:MAG: oligoendopeptidase F [Clostridia bacterium]|nr:oligoendopeptidase F [Clostridia bacterium]
MMANTIKTREDIDLCDRWNLDDIFPGLDAWETALREATDALSKIAPCREMIGKGPEQLREALDCIYGVSELVEKVYVYTFLRSSEDQGDSLSQDMVGRAQRLYMTMQGETAFLNPEILAVDNETMKAWLKEECLAPYRHILGDILRSSAHVLDEKREHLLANLSDAAGTPSQAFDMLEGVDMKFPNVHDEEGNEVPLTHGTFGVFRESNDRAVRKEAYEAYLGEYKKYTNTLAALYGGSVKMDCFMASTRGYEDARSAALFDGNIPTAVYDSLIEAVHEALPVLERYAALRRRVLGLDELHMYDLYCPLFPQDDSRVDIVRGKKMVLRAMAPLGERYVSLLREAFDHRWIDVYENPGKTTGAYSCGVYGVHPYVLLNYTDTLEDVFTLAHEMGHAMHSYFSAETQDYANNDYRIFVAEVASTVNEVFLTRALLKEERDPRRRAYLLTHFLEGFRTTVFRQTLFAEFEKASHAMYERGETLTAESMSAVYREINVNYQRGVTVDALHDIEWACIPHFYRAFYVYQYATGFCSAVAIADGVLESGDASDYLRFLTTGGSDYPLEELKIAGVDLTTPEPIRRAMKVFEETLAELESLVEQGI